MEKIHITLPIDMVNATFSIRDKHEKGELFEAILKYALFEESPDLDELTDMAAIGFLLFKPWIRAFTEDDDSLVSG